MEKQAEQKSASAVPDKFHGFEHFCKASQYTFAGLKACVKGEAAFRQDLVVWTVNLILALVLPLDLAVRALLIFEGCVLLTTELLNSALENIVDLVSPGWNEFAKRAKDMGSAAVFCILVSMGVTWLLVILRLCKIG